MHKHEEIPLDRLMRDPQQPRTLFVPGELTALSENIKKFGQRVPVIVFAQGDKFCLIDGERRARAKKLAGQPTVSAIVLPERPSEAELRMLQFSLDYHKASHTAMERSNHLARIMGETGCNVTELADKLDISQGMVSKLLAFQKLPEGLRAVLEKTPLDIEKVTQISKVKDPVRQIELVKSWGHLGREEFRDKVNDNGQSKPKSKRATFLLPNGMNIVVSGRESTLEQVIAGLSDVLKELRRGLSKGLQIVTVQRVINEKAKVKS